jgi:3',5'-cyclic AMP phosphodiesterase CpdA
VFRLAHFSDPHLGPLPRVKPRQLASKRILGYVTWQRSRREAFRPDVLAALIADMRAQKPDHVVVTGDLVNIGLDEEFALASAWLAELGPPKDVTVIPGNHDAYVRGSVASFTESWAAHMLADEAVDRAVKFPFVRRRGPVAIVGVSTAVASAPFMATGRIGHEQSAALRSILHDLAKEGLFRVVLIHHPPLAGSSAWHRRLIDFELAQSPIVDAGAELVIHGHEHRMLIGSLDGPKGRVPVIGAPTPSSAKGAYLLFDIGGGPGAYSCKLVERGARPADGSIGVVLEQRLA